jgi:hypothetical protein
MDSDASIKASKLKKRDLLLGILLVIIFLARDIGSLFYFLLRLPVFGKQQNEIK